MKFIERKKNLGMKRSVESQQLEALPAERRRQKAEDAPLLKACVKLTELQTGVF